MSQPTRIDEPLRQQANELAGDDGFCDLLDWMVEIGLLEPLSGHRRRLTVKGVRTASVLLAMAQGNLTAESELLQRRLDEAIQMTAEALAMCWLFRNEDDG